MNNVYSILQIYKQIIESAEQNHHAVLSALRKKNKTRPKIITYGLCRIPFARNSHYYCNFAWCCDEARIFVLMYDAVLLS